MGTGMPLCRGRFGQEALRRVRAQNPLPLRVAVRYSGALVRLSVGKFLFIARDGEYLWVLVGTCGDIKIGLSHLE